MGGWGYKQLDIREDVAVHPVKIPAMVCKQLCHQLTREEEETHELKLYLNT